MDFASRAMSMKSSVFSEVDSQTFHGADGGDKMTARNLRKIERRLGLNQEGGNSIRKKDREILLSIFKDVTDDPEWYEESTLFELYQ